MARHCSPLFFIILALVNSSTVDCDKDTVIDAVSYLICMFRAIRKAEDAVDIRITYKLHILADIGISIVNALNHGGISSAQAQSLILFPSSLYKGSRAKKYEEANSECSPSTCDGTFIKKIIHNFKSNTSLISCDSGEVELLSVTSENLETIVESCLQEKECVVAVEKPKALHLRQR